MMPHIAVQEMARRYGHPIEEVDFVFLVRDPRDGSHYERRVIVRPTTEWEESLEAEQDGWDVIPFGPYTIAIRSYFP